MFAIAFAIQTFQQIAGIQFIQWWSRSRLHTAYEAGAEADASIVQPHCNISLTSKYTVHPTRDPSNLKSYAVNPPLFKYKYDEH